LRETLNDKLENLWNNSHAWPDFIQVMRLALRNSLSSDENEGGGLSRLSSLPGLCCQAAGGERESADDLALAWLIFYAAAKLLDSVQDADEPGAWWVSQGASVALSAFSGLYFSASLALNALAQHPAHHAQAAEINEDFFNTFLVMGSGQHADLTRPSLSLEQYWQQADTKSGAFFSLACRSGARLATSDSDTLTEYSQFGSHLGLLIQITDDLEDVLPPQGTGIYGQRSQFSRSLPVVYALEVLPLQQRERLKLCLQAALIDAEAAQEAVSLVDQSNAASFIMIEIERHKQAALQSLERANPLPPAREALAKIIQEI
jgi:geranylgeranyl pyrophosphate synthase